MFAHIRFIENSFPSDFSLDLSENLYNNIDFINLKFKGEALTFYILNEKRKRVLGRVNFIIENGEAVSLPFSPFGYFELNDTISIQVLEEFVKYILEKLYNRGVKKLHIKSYAQAYNMNSASKINYVLLNQGFNIALTEINHHIPLEGDFEDKIRPMHLRKLQKCKKDGLVFTEEKVGVLSELYHFILGCREERGHGLSLEYSQMKALIAKFPDGYRIFSVRKQGVIIAATIVVIVNDEIIYNFFPASAKAYNILSPMVFLDLGLYNYCISQGYKILDLGISTTYGLINFKEGIGGEPSLKFVFEKLLK